MTETSGREKALRLLLNAADHALGAIDSGRSEPLFIAKDSLRNALYDYRAALASPSTQEPVLRGGKVEEIAECFAWQNMDSAPRDGSSILIRHKYTHGNPIEVYRYSAGSDVYPYKTWEPEIGRTASIKGAIFPSEEDNYDWAPLDSTERIAAALRTYAGESAAQSEPAPDASMTNADWLRAISAWVPQHADHLGEAADELNELRSEREQLTEQLAIRSESSMAKDMQEIMRINNELQNRIGEQRMCVGCGSTQTIEEIRKDHPAALACCPERKMLTLKEWGQRSDKFELALTAERQRRESAEKVALPLSQGWQSYGGIEKDKAGLLRGTLAIWDFENAAKHFSRYAHADETGAGK